MACSSGVNAKRMGATVGEIFAKFVWVLNSVRLSSTRTGARIRLKIET